MMRPPQVSSNSRYVVVVGCGRVGAAVACGLVDNGYPVRIMDTDPMAFEKLPKGRLENSRIIPVTGDGTLEADLVRAGIAEAEAIVAVTGNDNVNALAALAASSLFGVSSALCRIDEPEKQQTFNSLGLTAVSATALLAGHLIDSVVS